LARNTSQLAPDRASPPENRPKCGTGIVGLDTILGGGLASNHVYLIDGDPGTGKTTLGLQFLLTGVAAGERGMYVTLSESAAELRDTAASHTWSLDGIDVVELAEVQPGRADEAYTLFHPSEIELQQTVEVILAAIKEKSPIRVVIDSLSEMRLLARDPLRFRREILSLKQFFAGRQCTALFLDDRSAPEGDMQLHSLAHGVIVLDHLSVDYGAERRRLEVRKLRGSRFRGGFHDFRIRTGGLEVFPRLEIGSTTGALEMRELSSGSSHLDRLLGGGLTVGTSTLVTGGRARENPFCVRNTGSRPLVAASACISFCSTNGQRRFGREPRPSACRSPRRSTRAWCASIRSSPPRCHPANSPTPFARSSSATTRG
jgi:circadian clock protein KaiC